MRRNNGRGGFTLSEVLVVLAIVLILGGMTFTAAFSIRRNARQAACGRTAEAIYMAAQRNLYGLRAAGVTPITDDLVYRGITGSYDGACTIRYTASTYTVDYVVYEENGAEAVYPAWAPEGGTE